MARAKLSLICLALGACVTAREPQPVTEAPRPAPTPPGLAFAVGLPEADARVFVEEVAARCWLDTELQAAAVIVDRQTGNLVIVGETERLVEATLSRISADQTRLILTGAAIENKPSARRLVARLREAEATGVTAC